MFPLYYLYAISMFTSDNLILIFCRKSYEIYLFSLFFHITAISSGPSPKFTYMIFGLIMVEYNVFYSVFLYWVKEPAKIIIKWAKKAEPWTISYFLSSFPSFIYHITSKTIITPF